MGYAMFANRKVYYTNLIFELQSKLDNIQQQKQRYLEFESNIADGYITAEEVGSDLENMQSYLDFENQYYTFANTADADGGIATTMETYASQFNTGNISVEQQAAYNEMLNKSAREKFAKNISKKLEAEENKLDLEQQKLQTQLNVAQNELQAVEAAEQKGIQNATPKYVAQG